MSQASISSSTNQHESRQADLIKACVTGRTQLVRQLLSPTSISSASGATSAAWSTPGERDTLRIALQRAAGRDNVDIVQLLLAQGAEVEPKHDSKKGDEVGSLFRAAENGFTTIVEALLARGANPENARDRFGRLALAIAAHSGHEATVLALLKGGAYPDSRDRENRTVLLYLAWDKQYAAAKQSAEKTPEIPAAQESPVKESPVKQIGGKQSRKQVAEKPRAPKEFPLNEKILGALIANGADLDARDSSHRTPLIWAAVNGKVEMVRFLLEEAADPKHIVDGSNDKGRTALHFASESGFEAIVEVLLKNHANPRIASEGGWTALHNAAQKGHANIVTMLLNSGASPNAELSNGKTALHWAAQNGHKEIVERLLVRPDTRLFVKDSYERTPIICAAENGHDDIVQMLSPSKTGERLSAEAKYACNHFKATIVDFGLDGQPREKSQRVLDHSVFDLLYGWDSIHQKQKVTTQVKNINAKPAFRWIHLPHNNVAWAEAMLTKAFVEAGHREIAEFKALEKCFGQEHRGSTAHASFMRTFSQRIPPVDYRQPTMSSVEKITSSEVLQEENPFGIVPTPAIRLESSSPMMGSVDTLSDKEKEVFSSPPPSGKRKKGEKSTGKKTQKVEDLKKQNGNSSGKNTPNKKQGDKGKDAPKQHPKQVSPNGKIVLFMPYLHYESDLYRSRMSRAINRTQTLNPLNPDADASDPIPTTPDDMLVKAYLNVHSSNTQPGLHPRRTLDQFFYHGIDTSVRDQDQVVYRYCKEKKIELKVFMVDQLWMWILSKDLIVTCFPQRWQQPPNDPLNVLKGIIEDVDVKANKTPVKSVYDLAMLITNRCSGIFDRHRLDDINYQFIEMFESSLGHLTNEETRLFDRFNTASGKATRWLREHRRTRARRVLMGTGEDAESLDDPSFVDNLLDIRRETHVLLEIKDIRDELNILKMVLQSQLHILPDFAEHIIDEKAGGKRTLEATEVRKQLKDQVKVIEGHIKDLARMDKQAELIYSSLSHLLDLKQKHANAFEARFARDQAALTARQGQTIMVFTIVTIVFLPMSFIAAVFAINVNEFPHDLNTGQQSLPFHYLAKWMFGIGFGISIPLIILAFAVDDVASLFRRFSMQIGNFIARFLQKRKTAQTKRRDDLQLSIASNEKAAAFAADYDRQSRSSYGGVGGAYRRDFSPLSDRSLGRGSSVIQSHRYSPQHVHFDRSSFDRPR